MEAPVLSHSYFEPRGAHYHQSHYRPHQRSHYPVASQDRDRYSNRDHQSYYRDQRPRLPPTPPAETPLKMSLPPISTLFDMSRERPREDDRDYQHISHQQQKQQQAPRGRGELGNYDPRLMPPTPPGSHSHGPSDSRTSPMLQIPHHPSLPGLQSSGSYPPRATGSSSYMPESYRPRGSLQSEQSFTSGLSLSSAHPSSPESVSGAPMSAHPYGAHARRPTQSDYITAPPMQTTHSPQSPHSTISSVSAQGRGNGWRYDPYPTAQSSAAAGLHSHPTSPINSAGAAAVLQTTLASSADRYVCTVCNKAFSRPSSLKIHSHSHTGEKPFMCPHTGCGKAFSVRSNMKRHERGCHVGGRRADSAADTASLEDEEEE